MGAVLASQAAQAAFTANDLYLGFNQTSKNDYLIDLGQASGILGQSTVVDLSSYFSLSTFDSVFTSGATGVSMGVVGGKNAFPSSGNIIYATSPVGADMSGLSHSASTIGNAISDLSAAALPAAGSGAEDATLSWTSLVSPTYAPGSFYGDSGVNPSSAIDGTGVLTEGLWMATPGSGYTYQGFFTLDTGASASPSLTFTSVQAAPEPTTTAVLGGGALLLGIFRWRANRKNA
jgi:hypothetical protein